MAYVYKITSPTNRIYIGSTIHTNINKRFRSYKNGDCKKQIKLYNSFLKYDYDNHVFEILWEGEISEMLQKERYFGELYKVLNENNLNLKLPKLNEVYGGLSEESKKSHSLKMKNYWKRVKDNDENKRFWKREGSREEFSKKRKGLKYSDEAKLRMKNGQAKRYKNRLLVCYLDNEIIVESFNFIKDAAFKYNVPSSSICIAIKKGTKSAGYYWKYIIKDSQ